MSKAHKIKPARTELQCHYSRRYSCVLVEKYKYNNIIYNIMISESEREQVMSIQKKGCAEMVRSHINQEYPTTYKNAWYVCTNII